MTRASDPVVESVAAWRRNDNHHQVDVRCSLTDEDEPPHVAGLVDDRAGCVSVVVRPSWLLDVWVRGLAVVDGCFVLDVVSMIDGDTVEVLACHWERRRPLASEPVSCVATARRVGPFSWHFGRDRRSGTSNLA
jgi:hypothetical protein